MIASIGATACNKTIQRLIDRVANRLFVVGNLSPSVDLLTFSFPATPASLPEYYQLESFADREDYHARLQTFINAKAVNAEWDRRAGERGQLSRLTMINPAAAADLLECELPWNSAATAIQSLKLFAREGLPTIDHIIEGWRHGKSVGGITANKAIQFIDAMRVIDAAQLQGGEKKDLVLRRLSAHLFGKSKRIEALASQVAFLIGEPEAAEEEDVFARLGLVKYPQPMLLSGPLSCSIHACNQIIPFVRPYLGVRPDTIDQLHIEQQSIRCILTIENLASFNEAAQDSSNPNDLLLIYVAGNPTPSLLAAYNRIIQSIKPLHVMHWGDIDVGGYRIAARLADSAMQFGHRLKLWRMNPAISAESQTDVVSVDKINRITAICEKHGWAGELEGFKQHPVFQEQEFIDWEHPDYL